MKALHIPKLTRCVAPFKYTAPRNRGIVHVAWPRSIFGLHATLQSFTCLLVWGLLSLAGPTSTFGADNQPSPGFVALFNGRDQSPATADRKSTRLNSSHGYISYAVFCLKKKKKKRAKNACRD